MTVYGKIENNEFIPAPYGRAEDLVKQGYSAFTDEQAHKRLTKQLLQKQIDEMDIKRIRAICEPSDHPNGGTWLEYYTAQIVALRAEIASL